MGETWFCLWGCPLLRSWAGPFFRDCFLFLGAPLAVAPLWHLLIRGKRPKPRLHFGGRFLLQLVSLCQRASQGLTNTLFKHVLPRTQTPQNVTHTPSGPLPSPYICPDNFPLHHASIRAFSLLGEKLLLSGILLDLARDNLHKGHTPKTVKELLQEFSGIQTGSFNGKKPSPAEAEHSGRSKGRGLTSLGSSPHLDDAMRI